MSNSLFFTRRLSTVLLALAAIALCCPSVAAAAGDVRRLSLEQALTLALANNEDIQEGYGRVRVSEATVTTARGAYDLNLFSTNQYGRFTSLSARDYDLPQNATKSFLRTDTGVRQRVPTGATLSAYYTHTSESMLGIAGGNRRQNKNYATIEFVQSLLRGIGDKEQQGAIKNALLSVEDSVAARSLVVSQVTLDIVRAYWTLWLANKNHSISKEVLAMAQEVLRREGVRLDEGISQGVDVDRARMAVEQRQYTVLQCERDIAVAQEQLMLLINDPDYISTMTIVPVTPLDMKIIAQPNASAAKNMALNRRYELQQLVIILEQLGIEYDINNNKLLPTLDLSAGFTTSNGNNTIREADNFKDTNKDGSWFVGVMFTVPLQNREASGEVQKTSSLMRIAGDRLNRTKRSVETEVQDALHNLTLARNGIPVAKSAFDSARQTVAGELKRFEMGGVNNRDLLASHDALGREELNYNMAIVNYNITLAEYDYACAMLLDRFGIEVGNEYAALRKK